ncbi:unnamed protein product [Cylindrotheca closterium]|uniref:Uncharacterized protein n=1 Tax=Cylindrotheca closterium TaxID=2856 RepID=A0AAD2FSD0_9STRA|nr:unnamed protein product [Cylindrotheca closterium]
MSGRFQNTGHGSNGRNAGQNRSQQGQGNGQYNGKKTGNGSQKEKKFHPLVRGNILEFSFDEVKKTLVIKIVKLTLVLVTDDNNPDKEIKHEERRTNYLADQKDWKTRKKVFDNNKRNIYGMILKMCTDHMVDKLEQEADFDNKLFNDPVELLMRIKNFMTTTVDTEWEYFGLLKTMSNLINCHQKEKENIASFL